MFTTVGNFSLRNTFKRNSILLLQKYRIHTKPDFTKNNYNIKRNHFKHIEEEHLHFFERLLGESRVVTELSYLEKYNVDWYKNFRGGSTIALKPKTTEEVSKILSFCNDNRLAVCPQGGHTGVVGGGTPVFDEIVISTELMNEIIHLDEKSGVLTCQAGCILQNLDNYLTTRNLMVPLDLGSKGSCHIGGNVSTNAGGTRLFRFGSLHENVLGLEAVKANGEVLDCLNTLKKDNSGYHLKHLFIGSEGTLGLITKVAIQCKPRPKSQNVAFLGLQNYSKVLKTFNKSKEDLSDILSAFEVMDTPTMELVKQSLGKTSPIGDYPFYVLIETLGSDPTHDEEKLSKFLESCLLKHFVLNGTTAGEPSKIRAIWEIRERIPEGFPMDGYVFMYDVSLPLDKYFDIVDDMRKHMGGLSHRVFGFGHLGDSNLHLQISVEKYTPEISNYIEPYVYEKVREYRGSVSAEHGLGLLKAKYLPLMKSQSVINMMSNLKKMMDPNGILNPYKVLVKHS